MFYLRFLLRRRQAGTFLVATEDVLKSRAIKKAKRRNIGEAESGGSSFKGFKGFSLTPAPGGGPAPTGFSGFGNGGGGFTGLSGSTNGSSSTPAFTGFFSPASTATTPGAAFSAPKTEAARPTDENGEEETDEPPKVDVKEVKEDDAFYSKKCKLFYKKDSEFKEKGVGTLHLKKSDDDKVQLLIRADTNLGHILLNILLQASLPVSRLGKNNVMVVCVPNPPIDEKNPSSPMSFVSL
ncbi:Nuclear pore complex protein Nup50 [Dissostichus eleginoides]|uniref:Nuclear pore complex protein Nup50 n=1 Tax=Dissostichus eleginoides TaxID=100907 RepID=A0AAD9EN78_DISEL|nr:Nuclear pore complex protein Nup50 [Dissostichus eleginoides]